MQSMATWRAPASPQRVDAKPAEPVARGLGWFSLALGAAELFAPQALGRAIGVGRHPTMLPMLGLREIASGLGILSGHRTSGFLWSRVGGDAMDLALLALAMRATPQNRRRILLAVAAVAGVTLLDVLSGRAHGARAG